MTWENAQADCVIRGGNLATVESEAVQAELEAVYADKISYGFWIGLNKVDDPSSETFVWKDGCTSTYRKWAPGMP